MELGVFGAVTAVIVLFSLAGFVLLVVALVDLVRRPADEWARTGHNQIVWAVIVVFVWLIGPVLYLLVARPAFEAVPVTNTVAVDGR